MSGDALSDLLAEPGRLGRFNLGHVLGVLEGSEHPVAVHM